MRFCARHGRGCRLGRSLSWPAVESPSPIPVVTRVDVKRPGRNGSSPASGRRASPSASAARRSENGHQGAGRAPTGAQALPVDARRSRSRGRHCCDRPRRLGIRLGRRSRRRRSVTLGCSAERVPGGCRLARTARCGTLAASRGRRADRPRRAAVGRRRARAERSRRGRVGVGLSGVGDAIATRSLLGQRVSSRVGTSSYHSPPECLRARPSRSRSNLPRGHTRLRVGRSSWWSVRCRAREPSAHEPRRGRRTASARAGLEPPRETSTRSLPRSFAR